VAEEQRGDVLFGEKERGRTASRETGQPRFSTLEDIDPRGKSAGGFTSHREAGDVRREKETVDNFPGQGKFRDRDSRGRISMESIRRVSYLRKRVGKQVRIRSIDVDRSNGIEKVRSRGRRSCERVTVSFCK